MAWQRGLAALQSHLRDLPGKAVCKDFPPPVRAVDSGDFDGALLELIPI